MKPLIFRALRIVLTAVLSVAITLIVVAVVYLDSQPDLSVWHTADLSEEFREESDVRDLAGYLALEDRLFAQLDEKVYAKTEGGEAPSVNRYVRGSLADPSRWDRNWNRTFQLEADSPTAGVLLIHGLTDSPYSLRAIGEKLNACGAYVLGIRVPGHGTAPAALTDVHWQDMAAAIRIGVKHVREKVGDRPVYLVGYSNGGALAVNYALETLYDDKLPKADRIMLISPMIGVTPAAAFAVWQGRLGHVLGMRKLAWNSVLPEFDPYKYNSFPVNGGILSYSLTSSLRVRMEKAEASGKSANFPPTLGFQSAVDATVMPSALIEVLFDHLPAGRGNELVLFDLNRRAGMDALLKRDPRDELRRLLAADGRDFALTVVTNRDDQTPDIIAKQWKPGSSEFTSEEVGEQWPREIFSLSHLALPFLKSDSLYGDNDPPTSPGIALGDLGLRGENGVLEVSPAYQLRMHWNPFHTYMDQRMLDFFNLRERVGGKDVEPRMF